MQNAKNVHKKQQNAKKSAQELQQNAKKKVHKKHMHRKSTVHLRHADSPEHILTWMKYDHAHQQSEGGEEVAVRERPPTLHGAS